MRLLPALIVALAAPAFAQEASPRLDFTQPFIYDAPPAVIGPVQEPETLLLPGPGGRLTLPRDQERPAEIYTPGEAGSPSVSEFIRSLSIGCDPDRKPGEPAEPNAAPACPPPNEVYTTRPPFAPPKPDLHPDYGKAKKYPLTPL